MVLTEGNLMAHAVKNSPINIGAVGSENSVYIKKYNRAQSEQEL